MKKTIVASILGLAATVGVSTSYGQGNLVFGNYNFSSTPNYSAPVTYNGQVVGSDFSAELLYSPSGAAGTFNVIPGTLTPFYGTGLGDSADGGGLFPASATQITSGQGYTAPSNGSALAAYFEVYAFNTAQVGSYAAGNIAGTSGVVHFSTLATAFNLHLAGDMFADNSDVVTPLTGFTVSAVPEPTTLALAGLGGLASLIALRRKQA
jgi:hypothetical protein